VFSLWRTVPGEGQSELAQAQGAALALLEAYGVMFFVGGSFTQTRTRGTSCCCQGGAWGCSTSGRAR